MDVESDFAVLGAGGDQEIFRVEPLFQLLEHRTTFSDRLDQKIFRARKRVVDR